MSRSGKALGRDGWVYNNGAWAMVISPLLVGAVRSGLELDPGALVRLLAARLLRVQCLLAVAEVPTQAALPPGPAQLPGGGDHFLAGVTMAWTRG